MNVEQAQVLRFAVVGGLVTGTFMLLNHLLARRFSVQQAFLIAYVPAVALHFCLNKFWTFGDHSKVNTTELGQYALLTAVAFGLQWSAFQILTRRTSLPSWVASGVATVAQMAVAFLAMKLWVFAQGAAAS